MINAISERIAINIKKNVPEHPASLAVLQYSIKLFINTLSVILFSLAISLYTGRVVETTVAMIGFALLRQVSGGYHLQSGVLCILVSSFGITLLSFAEFGPTATLLMNGAAFILALLYAPSRIEKQTRIPTRYFKYLKMIALGMIALSAIIGYSVLAAAFLAQGLTLIRGRR